MKQRDRVPPTAAYRLRLIVAGSTDRSRRAVENLRRACHEHLAFRRRRNHRHLPAAPQGEAYNIVAAPTLVRLRRSRSGASSATCPHRIACCRPSTSRSLDQP